MKRSKNNKIQRRIFTVLIPVAAFCLGFGFKTLTIERENNNNMKRATGIGGIFFKCKNPQLVREWYKKHLAINTNEYGAVFEWHQGSDNTKKGFTQWSPFNESTTYFEPSTKDFMINYRVENLEMLVEKLEKEGVTIVDKIETVEYGKFIHILDIEGNKIELWEPNDIEFEKLGKKIGAVPTK